MSTLASVLKGGSVLIEALHKKYDEIIANQDSTNDQAFDQQEDYSDNGYYSEQTMETPGQVDNGYYCDQTMQAPAQVDNVYDCSYGQSGEY
jgi:hypothetical protein